jgi:hypothetical protein
MRVRDLGQAAQKFSTNGAAGANNYKTGVQSNQSWAQNTEAAQGTWSAGVQAASSTGRFAKGVAKAGQQKWQSAAANKGQTRFSQSMSDPNTKQNWQTGFAPYAQVLGGITVPPKGVRGAPQNYQIVQQIGDALHKAKVGG